MRLQSLIAVDPSLTCSGWALFSVKSNKLMAVGKIKSKPPSIPLGLRLKDVQEKILNVFEQLGLGGSDVLICEAQTTMRDPRAAFKVEQVRGIFEVIARDRQMCVPGRINPRTVHNEVMGLRGKQLARQFVKEAAVNIVQSLYGSSLRELGFPCDSDNLKKNQDIVDAILIGSLGMTRIAAAKHTGTSLEEIFSSNIKSRTGKYAVR